MKATDNSRGKVKGRSTMDTVLKVSDVARLLRVHPTTVYRLLKANGLPGIKLGSDWRFSQEAIERWMKENSERFEQS